MATNDNEYIGNNVQPGFKVSALFAVINNATASARAKLSIIQNNKSAIAIGDMFEMQMLMNHLSQLSEMATGIVAASQQVIMDMTRSLKG